MDLKDVGGLMAGTFLAPDSSIDDMLSAIDAKTADGNTPSELFPPLAIFSFPKPYQNRFGLKIDVLGAIHDTTTEHAQGYRFFDYQGTFYRQDGRKHDGVEHVDDLIAALTSAGDVHEPRMITKWKWVHPKHYDTSVFFKALDIPIKPGGHYVNRMGFVIEMQDSQHSESFFDRDGLFYYETGRRSRSAESMFDLVYEIVNWEIFEKSDVSTTVLKSITPDIDDGDIPEMFNPGADHRDMLMEEFFKAILKSRSLANQLGIDYSFTMDTGNLTKSRP